MQEIVIVVIIGIYLAVVGVLLFLVNCLFELYESSENKLKFVLFTLLTLIFITTVFITFNNDFDNKEYKKTREKILTNKYIPYEVIYNGDDKLLKIYKPDKVTFKDGYVLLIDDYNVEHYKIQKENLQKYEMMVLNGNLFILNKEIKIKILENQTIIESVNTNNNLTTFTLLAETYDISNTKIPLKVSYNSQYKYFLDLDLKIGETYNILEKEKNLFFLEKLYKSFKEEFK